MSLANISLTNTFDEWRVRTNQLIAVYDETNALANASFNYANSAIFTAANLTANILASNTIIINAVVQTTINVAPSIILGNTLIQNTIYTNANTITYDFLANLSVSTISDVANAAFDKANSANYFAYLVNANTVASFNQANAGYNIAVAGYNQANAGYNIAVAAYNQANNTTIGSLAFDKANSANILAFDAYARANVANNLATNAAVGTINFILTSASSTEPMANGSAGDLIIPFNAYIKSWALLSDVTANATIDIYKTTYSNYGVGGAPNATNTITGTEQLKLDAARKNTSTALTGWTTTINTNDVLRFNVNSVAAATKLTIALEVIKT